MSNKQARIGVGVIIFRDSQILLGERRNTHGENTFATPGGHLEWFETPSDCAKREVLEETGLELIHLREGPWTNDIFSSEKKHYITVFMLAQAIGEAKLKEPDKCLGWQWFDINNLPKRLFMPLDNLFSRYPHLLSQESTYYNCFLSQRSQAS